MNKKISIFFLNVTIQECWFHLKENQANDTKPEKKEVLGGQKSLLLKLKYLILLVTVAHFHSRARNTSLW